CTNTFNSVPALRKAVILGYNPIRPWMSVVYRLGAIIFLRHQASKGFSGSHFASTIPYWRSAFCLDLLRSMISIVVSTFTMVYHMAPNIPFKTSDDISNEIKLHFQLSFSLPF
ncbi:hypothetical protein H5410_047636, partial [Solanum commersonii]